MSSELWNRLNIGLLIFSSENMAILALTLLTWLSLLPPCKPLSLFAWKLFSLLLPWKLLSLLPW